MIFAQIPDERVKEHLEAELEITTDKKWYRRLIIVKFSAQQYSVKQLSEMFDMSERTIRRYIHAFNQGGCDQLRPKLPPGRPPKIADWTRADWDKVFEQTPNQYDRLETESRQWTYERIQRYLAKYHSIEVSLGSIYNSLRKTGRRTGRSKLRVGSPDPDYQVKRTSVENLSSKPERGN